MAVQSIREVLPRTFTHRFGESPTAEIKYHATTDGPTPTQTVLNTIGIFHGAAHPEYSYLLCTEGSLNELDRFHAEVTYSYQVPAQGTEDSDPNPLARADVWSFSTGGAAIPALAYYDGSGNGNIKPLVNSAFDFIEGAMTEESELRATISGNRAVFPVGLAAQVTNALNSDAFLGAAAYQWKCQGISGQQQVEVVNGAEIKYWSVSVELAYRQSGWRLMLPNVGWNYLEGGEKKRAYVVGPPPEYEKVASANVVALNTNGSIKSPGVAPDILYRRVHPEVAFQPLFGTPPF
jgi:hypothetical protein